jgi:hypothetical protein
MLFLAAAVFYSQQDCFSMLREPSSSKITASPSFTDSFL